MRLRFHPPHTPVPTRLPTHLLIRPPSPNGTYNPYSGAILCSYCSAGTYAMKKSNSLNCSACEVGKYSGIGAGSCELCEGKDSGSKKINLECITKLTFLLPLANSGQVFGRG